VDVHDKAVYILPAQKSGGKGDRRRIRRAQDFFHRPQVSRLRDRGREPSDMNVPARSSTPVETLQAALAEDMEAVNALIAERMASENAPRIPEVTAHLVGAGGKRLRPLLTLAAARLCGYEGENHRRLAATVEFIHTATLLHDDVVDESGRRRGRPTANLLWDNKSSVLVGDYLFARSFQLMVETGSLRVLDILSNAAAVIAEGEVLQLTAAANLGTTEVVRGKTAALFAAATEVGGVIAEAGDARNAALRDYGDALGVAFQIADDLLDYGGASATLGKNTGDDFRERKMSLPLVRAIAAASPQERSFWARTIEKGYQRDGDLDEAVRLMRLHGTLDTTRATALEHAARARSALGALPDAPIRRMLAEIADYVVARLV
jgi:octaprenyl-diphosphate synthase